LHCGKWDAPENLQISKVNPRRSVFHRECKREYSKAIRTAKKEVTQ
jgi:hypothetical protein